MSIFSKSNLQTSRVALITGASEGIGWELARVMAADGWNLILVARREELLAELAAQLNEQHQIKTDVIVQDLAALEAAARIMARLDERGYKIDALINNAGFGCYGYFIQQSEERLLSMLDVNIKALVCLTRRLAPGMVERGRGWIMNVASTAAFQAVPTNAVYAATKAFVLSFSEALAVELKNTGVAVSALCPGVTFTGFQRVAGAEHLFYKRGAMTAAEVARLGYRAMLRGQRVKVTGGFNEFLVQSVRFAPRWLAAEAAFKITQKRR